MGEYRYNGHAVWEVKYHLIWITKYRYKILRGEVAEQAREVIRQVCQAREVSTSKARNGNKMTKGSRSPRQRSLEPARAGNSSGGLSRKCDFQSFENLPAFSR